MATAKASLTDIDAAPLRPIVVQCHPQEGEGDVLTCSRSADVSDFLIGERMHLKVLGGIILVLVTPKRMARLPSY
jgi:hypothetical protein